MQQILELGTKFGTANLSNGLYICCIILYMHIEILELGTPKLERKFKIHNGKNHYLNMRSNSPSSKISMLYCMLQHIYGTIGPKFANAAIPSSKGLYML